MKKPSVNLVIKILIPLLYFFISNISSGQTFMKITDANNPIVSDPGHSSGTFVGTAWVDIDNDGKLDLYVCNRSLYKNLGNGNFTKLPSALDEITSTLSTTWADYNNDGYIDCYVTSTGAPKSFLYKNNGNSTNGFRYIRIIKVNATYSF